MISEFRKTIPERRFFVPRSDRFFFPWWTRGGWRDGKLDVEFHFTSDERPPRGGKEGKLSGRMQYSGRPRRQRMSSARETGYPNEIQYGNAEIISRGAPYLTYSACPETWVARTAAGMRLAAHGLHRTALWNRFNGEDSLWKPWYPMDGDTTLPPPFSRFMEGIVTVLGDMVVWDCARRIGILSRFVWYPCEFDSRIDIALRSGSIISSIYFEFILRYVRGCYFSWTWWEKKNLSLLNGKEVASETIYIFWKG